MSESPLIHPAFCNQYAFFQGFRWRQIGMQTKQYDQPNYEERYEIPEAFHEQQYKDTVGKRVTKIQ